MTLFEALSELAGGMMIEGDYRGGDCELVLPRNPIIEAAIVKELDERGYLTWAANGIARLWLNDEGLKAYMRMAREWEMNWETELRKAKEARPSVSR